MESPIAVTDLTNEELAAIYSVSIRRADHYAWEPRLPRL